MTSKGALDVRCLGGCELMVDGVQRSLSGRRAAVVAYVACASRPVRRAVLASVLWPDHGDAGANGNLRVLLSQMRRDAPALLEIERETVRLRPDASCAVDIIRFDETAERGLALSRVGAADAANVLRAGVAEYGGELLAGVDVDIGEELDAWLTAERTRLHVRMIRAIEALIDMDLDRSVTPPTRELAERLVAIDEFSEAAMARLLRVMSSLGDRTGALRRYDQWSRHLKAEFGLSPAEELATLAASIRDDSASRQPAPMVTSRLPSRPTLIGRDADVKEVRSLLAGDAPVVTITGEGGVGKTSLVVEICHLEREQGERPVAFVDLVDVRTSAELASAILGAVGDDTGLATDALGLAGRLTRRDLLLVLDNFEQLLGERDVIARLAQSGTGLRVLLTSRAPLHLAAEHVYALAPLDIPEPEVTAPAELLAAGAVRFFVRCADRNGARLTPDLETLSMTARICEHLDGVPLAIELAAAQVPVFGLGGLFTAFEEDEGQLRLELLGRGRADATDRHRTARDVVEWSYSLLSSSAQTLFRRLAVFDGSFDLDAAIGVCLGGEVTRRGVIEALAELVDFHLVGRHDTGIGAARFRLPVTLRSYAMERLGEENELDELSERHASYFAAMVDIDRRAESPSERSVQRFAADLANITVAVDWFDAADRHGEALEMLASLGPFWRRGPGPAQGLQLLDRSLAAAAAAVAATAAADPVLVAECSIWRASLVAERSGHDAVADVAAALDLFVPMVRDARRPGRSARCLAEAVHASAVIGDFDRAVQLAASIPDLGATAMDRWWSVAAKWESAMVWHLRGDDEAALAMIGEVIAEARAIEHSRIELYAWMWVDLIGADRTAIAEDPPGLEQLLDMAVEAEDRRCTIWLLVSLGTVAAVDGRLSESAQRFAEAMTLAREIDYRHGIGFATMGLVGASAFAGDLTTAARFHGVLESQLTDLRNVMPRSYFDAYTAVADDLISAATTNKAVAAEISAGRRLPSTDATGEAHRLLRDLASG